MALSIFIAIVAIVLAGFILVLKRKYSYWSDRNVPFVPPRFPYGNLQGVGKKIHLRELLEFHYKRLKGTATVCGLYFFTRPVVLVLDMELIRNVLIKDFHSFQERGIYYNEKDDPLSAHLFALDGPSWKRLRTKLTPTFTSGKMKFMFPTIVDVADQFQHCLASLLVKDDVLEIKELLARFTTDVIGTCAFGIDCNSLKDPNAEFRAMGKKVFGSPRNDGIMIFFLLIFRNLARALHVKVNHDDVAKFFSGVVRETIEMREKNGIRRNDFMDLLIEMKNRESVDGVDGGAITIDEIAAQAFVFFLAGFETSSTTMSFAMHELALNTDIQKKARQEVEEVLTKHGGKLTYEAMMEMHYIDCIINESLRKYPPVMNLLRQSTEDYYISSVNATIDKGTMFLIPVYAIQHDPEYYPNPEKFDPDRFTDVSIQSRPHQVFLPFGDGPRNCIGLRFGMMQARIGLITLLHNFEFVSCAQTIVPLQFNKSSVILSTTHGLFMKFKKISKTDHL